MDYWHSLLMMAAVLSTVRLLRILNLRRLAGPFLFFRRVYSSAKDSLYAAACFGFCVWLLGSTLLYRLEFHSCTTPFSRERNSTAMRQQQRMPVPTPTPTAAINHTAQYVDDSAVLFVRPCSIPEAMYVTAVFVGGDWERLSFSVPGQVVCMALSTTGIFVYALVVGAIYEGVESSIQEQKERHRQYMFMRQKRIGLRRARSGLPYGQ
jgi:hypothetical protein